LFQYGPIRQQRSTHTIDTLELHGRSCTASDNTHRGNGIRARARSRSAGESGERLRTVGELGWFGAWSVEGFRDVLRRTAPGLGDCAIVLDGSIDTSRPKWAAGSAFIGGEFRAKLAFSKETAERLWQEARVLKLLGERSEFLVPEVVAASCDPVFFATRLVAGGGPLSYELVSAAIPGRVDEIGAELAAFLSSLHRPEILALAGDALGRPVRAPEPGPQATTDELRTRLTPLIRSDQADLVYRCCAWVDDVLACSGEPVFVHGDFHGYNQLWDQRRLRLRLVADFETSGAAEAEYDLRVIPALGPGVDLLTATTDHYARRAGKPLDLDRIMAWHVRTTLGDALWRTEAGLPLLLPRPGGGTPSEYVDELKDRFDTLRVGP
jgi:aminoglycoside phosphotransferase (APT) family kinase protein